MKPRFTLATCLLLLILLALLPAASLARVPQQEISTPEIVPSGPFVVRIYYERIEDIGRLAHFDVFEYNNVEEKYWLAAVDAAGYRELQALGFRVQVDAEETANFARLSVPLAMQPDTIPSYPCYRTVEETFAAAAAIAASHPTLATWSDAGNSWEKATVTSPDLPGYDMMVLVLTNSAIAGPKPKLFLSASIHAREYTPAELATRFAEYLVNNYNLDADATWLLDHHEIHLMLQANPDGRKQAETGLSWRKNTNGNYCGATSTNRGADLNRNFTFAWKYCTDAQGCSSGVPCDLTYRGPSAASEPETQAVQNYMSAIFPDQRAAPLTSPAPPDATGVYMDIHSYSELVLWPWGFTSTVAPNSTALQTLGRKFAYFNGYTPQQAVGLYPTDGTTGDHAYGELGVAAYTFELGTAFFQACSTFENTIVPGNLPALIYAAKVVRTPYQTPAGPDALSLALSPDTVAVGNTTTLTASINDTRYNQTNGTEATQNIAAAEYYVDVPPWQAGAVAVPMTAADGSFNSTVEGVTATVNTAGLTPGRHIIFVRGKDANNNWGAFSAIFLTAQASGGDCTTYTSTDVPKTINSSSGVISTLTVPDTYPITDVNVTIGSITHANDDQLDIHLLGPDGTTVELSTDNGGSGDNYTNTVFDDEGGPVIGTTGYNTAPFTGRYRPEGWLAAFDGQSSTGANPWRLRVVDDTSAYNGTLSAWSLILCGSTTDHSDAAAGYGKAWHTGGGSLKLGAAWTADTAFIENADNASDDGVLRNYSQSWNDGRGEVYASVTGPANQWACLNAWLDYSDGVVVAGTPDTPNYVFDANEHVVNNLAIQTGAVNQLVTWPLAQGVINTTASYNMRFRLVPAPNPTVADCSGVTLAAADAALAPDGGAAITGGAAGGEVEDYAFSAGPTAILLASMTATAQGDAIEVTWDTVSESGNAGFNLYRDTSAAGPGVKLNSSLIPSQSPGSTDGYHYSYLDNGWLAPGTTYYYWLEDVSTTGFATRHEPVSVPYTGGPTAVGLGRFGASPALPALPIAALLMTALVAGAAVARRRKA